MATNVFIDALTNNNNKTLTENGAVTYSTTTSKLFDLFALGGAYRTRSNEDCILLFKNAFEESPTYTMKCLFYLRDILEGQGERRFFRVVCEWLAINETETMRRNLQYIPQFGRWDDLYAFVNTPLENDAFTLIRKQLALDLKSKTPSLLAKWLKSENTSSQESRILAHKTRVFLNMTHKQYRQMLSTLRERIKVLERLMSAQRWDEIEFDKIPSKAGLIYRNAFAHNDITRERYLAFINNKNTKVNAKTLYPYDIVHKAIRYYAPVRWNINDPERVAINKYWDNLTDYFKGCSLNAIAVVDTSGSMYGTPIEVAISIGMYCAEHNSGPFANKFFTFHSDPSFVEIEGIDFVDKVNRILKAPWGGSTNIEAVFGLMLETAIRSGCPKEDIPKTLIIISDMEFDACTTTGKPRPERHWWEIFTRTPVDDTLLEKIKEQWEAQGYDFPHIIFWNVNARYNTIPMKPGKYVSLVSGMSPVLFEQVLKEKSGYDLMFEKLNSKRYKCIHC